MSDDNAVIPAPSRRLVCFRFPEHGDGHCSYCDFDPGFDLAHECDGFGHGITEDGDLVNMGCRGCALGYSCEKAAWLLKQSKKKAGEQ